MKLLGSKFWMWAAALALLAAPVARPATAQTVKPVIVLSIASIEENLDDVGYITKAAGAEDAGKTARFFGNAFTNGLDKTKPIGMYVVPQAGDFHAVVFVPVKDLKLVLGTFKEQLGEPREAGEGVLEVGDKQTVFIKEQNGWAFIAQSKDQLTALPQDPQKLLGKLPEQYNIAVKVLMQNVPPELRQLAADEIKVGVKRALEAQSNGQPELAKQLNGNVSDALSQLFDEVEEFSVGFAINADTKATYIDINQTAVDGSKLAKQLALLSDSKSAFAGFLLPDASATFNTRARFGPDDIKKAVAMLEGAREQVHKTIDDNPELPAEKRGPAKEVADMFVDVAVKTIESGKTDAGAALVLEPGAIRFAAGGYVADGKAIDNAIKKLVDLAKDQPDFPEVKLNAGSHAGVTFHRITASIPDSKSEAKQLLGDKLEITLGTGPQSAYLAFGKDSEGLLKRVIDQSASDADKVLPPGQFTISLLPILKFAESVDDNGDIRELISTLEKAQGDKISIVSHMLPRGAMTRFQVESGVIKVIGDAVQRFAPALQGLQGL